jgi:Xaa-Pro dipeptidase
MAEFATAEYTMRISKLQEILQEKNIQLAVLNRNTDLYYYTGSILPLYLLVPAAGEPVMISRKALQRIEDEVPHIKLRTFNTTRDLKCIVEEQYMGQVIKRAGFTFDSTAYATVLRWQQIFGEVELLDLSWEIRWLRMVKSQAEIAVFAKAGQIFEELPRLLKNTFTPGMTELELSATIENFLRLHGHGGLVRCRAESVEMIYGVCSGGINALAGNKFSGICGGTGITGAVPYGASHTPIKKGEPVILDYGFNLEGYHLDQTRMFSWDEPSNQVTKAYLAMLQIEQAIMADLQPGRLWQEVYFNAVKLAAQLGYEEEFMGLGAEKIRFVGHGVGLELDEPPFLAPKMEHRLSEGMVVAIEPKVALPGVGIIGIEDTLVVRAEKPELLTTVSREFFILT